MKFIFWSLAFILISINSYAQSESEKPATPASDEEIVSDEMPVFPKFEGGDLALLDYLKTNFVYPTEAKAKAIEGIVYIRFEVDINGKVVAPFMASLDLGYGTGQEAIRLINSTSGKWTPGSVAGVPTQLMIQLPVKVSMQ
jgi:hypothetical protein